MRVSVVVLSLCLAVTGLRGLRAQTLDSARTALTQNQVELALRLAEQYVRRHARDPNGYVLLGDVYRQRPNARFAALRSYQDAMQLAPDAPEPFWHYAQVGIEIGGDDGEAIARRGLERVIELNPEYRNAWTQWLLAFRNNSSRRRMRERLAKHDSIPAIRARIALLLIEEGGYDEANAILDSLLAADSENVEWLALRAQSAFESDSGDGGGFYIRALNRAAVDSGDVLWRQVIGIASPDEIATYDAVAPDTRGLWLAAFWARRNPSLFESYNGRVREHFQRFRYARRHFPLLHPLVTYHRSQIARALSLEPARGEREFYSRCEMSEAQLPRQSPIGQAFRLDRIRSMMRAAEVGLEDPDLTRILGAPPAGASRARDRARTTQGSLTTLTDAEASALVTPVPASLRAFFVPLNLDLNSVDTIAARIGYNLATGLDDRGVLYLRFGTPQGRNLGGRNALDPSCNTPDVETWRYDELGEIRFARPSAFSRGERTVSEMVLRSMNSGQFEAMAAGLSTDAPSEAAPLEFGVWTAQFAGARGGTTEIAVVTTRGELAAQLVGSQEPARHSPNGVVMLEASPGRYDLVAHVRDSSQLGRQNLSLEARQISAPGMSDLLLAPAWTAERTSRWDMLRHVRSDLIFHVGETMRVYAELYGMAPQDRGVKYLAQYSLLRTDNQRRDYNSESWPEATQLSFVRERPAQDGPSTVEVLDISPERLPAGRYLLRLSVQDQNGQGEAMRSQIAFEVR